MRAVCRRCSWASDGDVLPAAKRHAKSTRHDVRIAGMPGTVRDGLVYVGPVERQARAYYNDVDPYCAAWLRNLIADGLLPDGDVDERSIADVRPSDLAGYIQCHFFAGIGGWALALRLAGWPAARPVWSGSCPCQPLSSAGKHRGEADERHLWPEFQRLIRFERGARSTGAEAPWSSSRIVLCDESAFGRGSVGRRVGAEPEFQPLAARLPARLGDGSTREERLGLVAAKAHQSGVLKGAGNSIVPQVAATFVRAYMGSVHG